MLVCVRANSPVIPPFPERLRNLTNLGENPPLNGFVRYAYASFAPRMRFLTSLRFPFRASTSKNQSPKGFLAGISTNQTGVAFPEGSVAPVAHRLGVTGRLQASTAEDSLDCFISGQPPASFSS